MEQPDTQLLYVRDLAGQSVRLISQIDRQIREDASLLATAAWHAPTDTRSPVHPFSAGAHHKIHVIDVFDDRLELFRNREIDRHLSVAEKRVFLDALEQDHCGRKGRWLATKDVGLKGNDAVQKSFFLILWRPLEESVVAWMDGNECEDVILLESLLEGLGMDGRTWGEGVVRGALEVLVREKKVKVFTHKNSGRKFTAVKRL